MKKLTALLVAAMFSLSAVVPVGAAPADDSLAMVPATPVAAKSVKKHKKAVNKHKNVRKAKHKHAKARAHKRLRRH